MNQERVDVGSNRRPLKILHIDPERAWGGGEAQVVGLLSYLSLRGHINHLLCHPRGYLMEEAKRRGITTFPITVRNDLDLRPIFRLRRLICSEGYDIIHFHTKRAHTFSLWLRRGKSKVNWVVTRRMDYAVKNNWYNRYLYNRRVDGVVAISEKIAGILVEGGVRREKIRVIHSGIDLAPFQKVQRGSSNSSSPVIGTVAVMEERKGHRFLLEAAALLKQQGHQLSYRFAGDGSQRERLKKIALGLGLQQEVTFEGFVSDIPNFLSAIDILVLSSLYEGLGVAVLEAMAAGKAVIATRVGGLPELVHERVTGLLVPPRDPQALAQSIAQLVSQRHVVQRMGSKARERVQQYFTLEQMAKKNEDYYFELGHDHREKGLN
ncbi:MAG: glycosyltransferase family 4 protein [Candidatus Binatia bacterium]